MRTSGVYVGFFLFFMDRWARNVLKRGLSSLALNPRYFAVRC